VGLLTETLASAGTAKAAQIRNEKKVFIEPAFLGKLDSRTVAGLA